MSKKTILGAAVAGATALAVFGLAGPAQASSADVCTTTGCWNGMMRYNDLTIDDFQIWDWSSDGYGVRGEIRSGGGTLLSWNYVEGNGNTRTWAYDLAKSKSYVIKVCRASSMGDTTPINCASEVVRDN